MFVAKVVTLADVSPQIVGTGSEILRFPFDKLGLLSVGRRGYGYMLALDLPGRRYVLI